MDALNLLKEDHKRVHALFKKFKDTSETALKTREKIIHQVQNELTIHAALEEKLFYPALKEQKITENLTFEAYEEHALVKLLISEIDDVEIGSEEWNAKIKVLQDLVDHHVEEEENDLFPKVKKVMPKEWLENLGNEIMEFKKINK